MLIAKVQGQTVLEVGDYTALYPDTSFPPSGPDAEWYVENSCMPVSVWLPYDATTQYLEPVAPYIQGEYVYTVQVAQMNAEQLAQYQASVAAGIGYQAQQLLSQTDWTTIPSVADPAQSNPYLTNQSAFIAWRSQVRAIAVTPEYTSVIPTQPVAHWSNQSLEVTITPSTTASATITI
jgi:hypothetical protein